MYTLQVCMSTSGVFIQGVFKKRMISCYKDFIAHFTAF